MRRHGPARHEDHKTGNEIALGSAVPPSAQPDTCQTSAPPDDAHGRVLPVILDPGSTPTMLGESIDTAPGGNDNAVEELLAAAGAAKPELTNKQQNGEQHAVGNEGAAHDEVCETLSQMIALAETKRRNATEQHLYPRHERERLPVDAMREADGGSDSAVDSLFEV